MWRAHFADFIEFPCTLQVSSDLDLKVVRVRSMFELNLIFSYSSIFYQMTTLSSFFRTFCEHQSVRIFFKEFRNQQSLSVKSVSTKLVQHCG